MARRAYSTDLTDAQWASIEPFLRVWKAKRVSPRLRGEHSGDHAPGRATDLDLGGDAGHLHDTSCARELGVTAALNWSAAELDLPALADSGL